MGVKNQITETSSLKKQFLEARVLSPNLNEDIEETPYVSEQRVVLLISAHLPVRYSEITQFLSVKMLVNLPEMLPEG